MHFNFDHISLSSWNETIFGTNLYRKSGYTFYSSDKVVLKLKAYFMFHNYIRKSRHLSYNVKKYGKARLATDEIMKHAHCVIDTKGYKRTLTKCNIYWFSTPTIFALKQLNITLHIYWFFFSGWRHCNTKIMLQ